MVSPNVKDDQENDNMNSDSFDEFNHLNYSSYMVLQKKLLQKEIKEANKSYRISHMHTQGHGNHPKAGKRRCKADRKKQSDKRVINQELVNRP